MSERVIISEKEFALLEAAEELLEQIAQDAEDIGQAALPRIALQGAEWVRKVTSRAEKLKDGSDARSLRGFPG